MRNRPTLSEKEDRPSVNFSQKLTSILSVLIGRRLHGSSAWGARPGGNGFLLRASSGDRIRHGSQSKKGRAVRSRWTASAPHRATDDDGGGSRLPGPSADGGAHRSITVW